MNQSFYLILSLSSLLINQTRAHGYLASPRSRNFVAHEEGLGEKKDPIPGIPSIEYCHTCLNRNAGVCGLSIHDHNYDDWLDSTGSPMPWISQATYEAGGIVRINSVIKAHHYGHFEVSACPDGRASTQECFDQHRLMFVQDIAHGMPADPQHPERGYLSLGEEFVMDFQLPESVSGETVLLQWRYIAANSCNPDNYHEYFAGANSDNELLPEEFWNRKLTGCNYPLPLDGSRGYRKPEQFFNCAEITILSSGATPEISSSVAQEAASPVVPETESQVTPEAASTIAQEAASPVAPATSSPVSSPVSSSLMQELTNRIDTPDAQEAATEAPVIATAAPVTQETTDWPVPPTTASQVASPISPPTASPVLRATAHPSASPIVQESTSPTVSIFDTTVPADSPVTIVSNTENDVIVDVDAPQVEAPQGDLVDAIEAEPTNTHNDIEHETTNSITIEEPGNTVQASPLPLNDSNSAGSRTLPSLLALSLVLLVQPFW